MIEFFVDTSTSLATIAIIFDKKVIKKKEIVSNKDLSSNIFKYIVELFEEASIEPAEIKKIYVVNGPGSFTGIRIGVTIAKVLAYSLKINIVPISSLQALSSSNKNTNISLIDARRGYVFAGFYDDKLNKMVDDCYIELSNIKKDYPNSILISRDDFEFPVEKPNIDIERLIIANSSSGYSSENIKPNYLKITEAEANLQHD